MEGKEGHPDSKVSNESLDLSSGSVVAIERHFQSKEPSRDQRQQDGEQKVGFLPPPPPPPPPRGPPSRQPQSRRLRDPSRQPPPFQLPQLRLPMSEYTARRLLTTHAVYSIRKVESKPGERGTWLHAKVTKEEISSNQIQRQLRQLSEVTRSLNAKRAALFPNQQAQLTDLLEQLNSDESDDNFEWVLEQLSRTDRPTKSGLKETVEIRVYCKRVLKNGISALAVFDAINSGRKHANPHHLRPQTSRPKIVLPGPKSLHDTLLWNWSQTQIAEYDETIKSILVAEYWLHSDQEDAQPTISEKQLQNIQHWLRQSFSNNEHIVGGLRLIFQKQVEPGTIPFPKAVSEDINRYFNLPAVDSHQSSKVYGTHGKFTMRNRHPAFVMWRSSNDATISTIISYDPNTNVTVGYILYAAEFQMDDLIPRIIQQYANFAHPLVIPLLMAELTIEYLTSGVALVDEMLGDMEENTRGMERKERDSVKEGNWAPFDYHPFALDLGEQTSRFARLSAQIQTAIASHKFLLGQIQWMESQSQETFKKLDEKSSSLMQDRIEYTLENLEQMLRHNGIEKRLLAHQNYLFNLIAQQDNAMNYKMSGVQTEIAGASKRDSSAMKTIALLTTLFLPGTFVSTLFSMPILDLGPSGNNKFWVYWAITIPLTIIVMIVVSFVVLPPGNQIAKLWTWVLRTLRMRKDKVEEASITSTELNDSEKDKTDEESVEQAEETEETQNGTRKRPWWRRQRKLDGEETASIPEDL